MDALYNDLVNGQPEYKEDGTCIRHAPSSVQLRAARALKQFAEINTQNQITINHLQEQVNQYLFEIQKLNENINELRNPKPIPSSDPFSAQLPKEASSDESTESVRPSEGETSTVGRSDGLNS